jgi:hypothetical protein
MRSSPLIHKRKASAVKKTKTMEHLLHRCANYSSYNMDPLAGRSLTKPCPDLHTCDYIFIMTFTPFDFVYNKPLPFILLHGTDTNVLLQYCRSSGTFSSTCLGAEEWLPHIQAHHLSVLNELCSVLEYPGALTFLDALQLLAHEKDAIFDE